MNKTWLFKGYAIQVGAIGHGSQTNSIDSSSGLNAMLDKKHIAVKGGFRQLLQLPDGTIWSSAGRLNTNDQVPFVMKLDVSSTQGVGAGTSGWAKLMDESHPGGANVYSVHGDEAGNLIVSYKGCGGFDASATSTDAFGRTVQGSMTDCKDYIAKLSSTDGSDVWKFEIPHPLYSCHVVVGGHFFCGWSMAAADGILNFGNGVSAMSADGRAGVVKFNSDGVAQWASATASTSFSQMAVSPSGDVLAVIGSSGFGTPARVTRVDTSTGNEGNVLWSDPGGVGSHGLRGVEVTHDGAEVVVMGQITETETLTDASGYKVTLSSRGSYEVYVAAYDAADGTGKYAMDGGGTGMEYFFAMASDPDTHEVYFGGNSRCAHCQSTQPRAFGTELEHALSTQLRISHVG